MAKTSAATAAGSPPRIFPPGLLDASVAERLEYFWTFMTKHQLVEAADKELTDALNDPGEARIILVYGPTGSGKTTMLRTLHRRTLREAAGRMAADPGHIPIVKLEAVAPGLQSFRWPDYHRRGLTALGEPLVDRKILPGPEGILDKNRPASTGRMGSGAALNWAWELALRGRGVGLVLIDEAQHLAQVGSSQSLMNQLDSIKSQANRGGAIHVLFGDYKLLNFRNLSDQLIRRSSCIHLPRYRWEVAGDLAAFREVLKAFQRRMPFQQEPDLIDHWEYCYERSVGSVGVLKEWLAKALVRALRDGSSTLHWKDHVVPTAPTLVESAGILRAARDGEARLVR